MPPLILTGLHCKESPAKLYDVEKFKLLRRVIFLGSVAVESLSFTLASKLFDNEIPIELEKFLLGEPKMPCSKRVYNKLLFCSMSSNSPTVKPSALITSLFHNIYQKQDLYYSL